METASLTKTHQKQRISREQRDWYMRLMKLKKRFKKSIDDVRMTVRNEVYEFSEKSAH